MLTGASVEDDAVHSFSNEKTCAHVMRQQLFSPAVHASVFERQSGRDKKKIKIDQSMERRKSGATFFFFEETAQAANYDHK